MCEEMCEQGDVRRCAKMCEGDVRRCAKMCEDMCGSILDGIRNDRN